MIAEATEVIRREVVGFPGSTQPTRSAIAKSFQVDLIGVDENGNNKLDNIINMLRQKDLGDYGVIVWIGHGHVAPSDSDFFLSTDYPLTVNLVNENRKDILNRNLQRNLSKYDADSNTSLIGELSIGSGFIKAYSTNKGSNAIVYISTCESLHNNAMSDAFLDIGAGAYFGYTHNTGDAWALWHGQALFRALSTGRSTSVNELPGLHDKEKLRFPKVAIEQIGSEFDLRGRDDIVLVR